MTDPNRPSPTETTTTEPAPPTHPGSCHCKAVRFEVDVDLAAGATRCNCTLCTKLMLTGVIVKPHQLRLVSGEEHLTSYPNAIGVRWFCKRCGVHLGGRGHLAELGGDFASANVNALDDVDPNPLPLAHWDGRHDNWYGGTRHEPWPIFA